MIYIITDIEKKPKKCHDCEYCGFHHNGKTGFNMCDKEDMK